VPAAIVAAAGPPGEAAGRKVTSGRRRP